jgi:hypothetical protein
MVDARLPIWRRIAAWEQTTHSYHRFFAGRFLDVFPAHLSSGGRPAASRNGVIPSRRSRQPGRLKTLYLVRAERAAWRNPARTALYK